MAALARKLLVAAAEGDAGTAKSMAARGANLNVMSDTGDTALLLATRGNHLAIVEDLARRGADLEAREQRFRWTALVLAASKGYLDIATLLLESRADPEAAGKDGETALMLAALLGRTPVAEVLLEHGAEVDACADDGKRGLTHACYKGFWATALCFVAHGACLNLPDEGGRSPMAWAANRGHTDIVRFLAGRSADLEARDRLGWSSVMLAAHGGHLATVKCLVERRADPEVRGADGETALMLAALMAHEQVVRFLASCGVALDVIANDGMTAIQIAAEAGHFDTAVALAEHGADLPEEGLAVARKLTEATGPPNAKGEKRMLENPGGLTLTRRLAEQLVSEFEAIAAVADSEQTAMERCNAAAQRWGFAPTELGYRRLLRVVEDAGVDAERLKRALHDTDALQVDAARDGLFDWDELGGIEDEDE